MLRVLILITPILRLVGFGGFFCNEIGNIQRRDVPTDVTVRYRCSFKLQLDQCFKPAFTWQILSWYSRPENSDEFLPSLEAVPELRAETLGRQWTAAGVSVARARTDSMQARTYVHHTLSYRRQIKANKLETPCLQGSCCNLEVAVLNLPAVWPLPDVDSAARFCSCPAVHGSWRDPLQEATWGVASSFLQEGQRSCHRASSRDSTETLILTTKIRSQKNSLFSQPSFYPFHLQALASGSPSQF